MKQLFRVILALLAFVLAGCEKDDYGYGTEPDSTIPSLGTPPNNEIWFSTNDNKEPISLDQSAFDVEIESIEVSEFGINTIRFVDTVTTIGKQAFSNCHNLLNISLPISITTIEERAFFECINMECLTLERGLRSCGFQAFDNCGNLNTLHIYSIGDWCLIDFASRTANPAYYSQTLYVEGTKIKKLSIPSNLSEIKPYAFTGNTAISEVIMPASVRTVGAKAFEECNYISKVTTKDVEAWCSIEFADEMANPLSIAGNLYSETGLITDLTISEAEIIKSRAFILCTSLTRLTIGDETKAIENEAFRGCTSLTTLSLGAEITNIGKSAFMGCMNLSKVECYATTPPTLGDKYVFGYNADNRTIAVPAESLKAYKEHADWSIYADHIIAIQ